ncbi:MAG: alpha/beta hydrolase [Gammaproteobacteria bacterium]|nr:alpha/beta hydrolase [Gammaproteobacteria bacterium]
MSTAWCKSLLPRRAAVVLLAVGLSGCSALALLSAASPNSSYQRFADISYGDSPSHRLDLYQPVDADTPPPVVVFFYGGGWRRGDKDKYEFVAASLTRAGYCAVLADYRTYPDVTFPAFIEDGAAAVAWTIANARRYGANGGRVYLMGHSAGAHIAALLALDERYLAAQGVAGSIAGLIGLSGPYDFLPLQPGYLNEVFPEATRNQSQPVNFVSDRAPPVLLVHGTGDTVVLPRNSRRLAQRLQQNGVPVTLRLYDGVGHARVAAALAPPLDFIAGTLEDSIAFIASQEAGAD